MRLSHLDLNLLVLLDTILNESSVTVAAAKLGLSQSATSNALRRLRGLIEKDALESEFQTLFDQNWWMLGGRYIRIIPRRDWTDRESLDLAAKRGQLL